MRLTHGLIRAERCPPQPLPRPITLAQRNGLRYQRRLGKALLKAAILNGAALIPDPWFSFHDAEGPGTCVPDFLLEVGDLTLVIEAKLTYVSGAVEKLRGLYLPIVMAAQRHLRVRGLAICHSLTPETPPSVSCLLGALKGTTDISVMLWREGTLPWKEPQHVRSNNPFDRPQRTLPPFIPTDERS